MRFLIPLAILAATTCNADFTTYIGGANDQYMVGALAADSAGDTYITGGYAFVTKLDPSGNIVFTIPVGGQCCSIGLAIAVDPSGDIWVGGDTTSPNLPLVNALQSTPPIPGATIGLLVKMAPDGTILYCSYFGGTLGVSSVNGIATDENGNVYVTGTTSSSDFPTTPGLPAGPVNVKGGISGAFATKLNPSGQKIIYSALIAGTQAKCSGTGCSSVAPSTTGTGIAIDGSGNALVAGSTNTSDLPVPPGSAAGSGPFVLKLNAAGNELVYLNYIGPAPGIINGISTTTGIGATPIAADAAGNAYIAGYTNSPDFQTTPGSYQTTLNSPSYGAAFAIKLDPAGATIWSTLLDTAQGGSAAAYAISLDGSNNVWLTGNGELSSGVIGSFVNELSADGSTLLYSLQLPQDEAGLDSAVDPGGVIHVLGNGSLVSTIATPSDPANPRVLSILNAAGGQSTGLIAPGEIISIYGWGLTPTAPLSATPENGIFPTALGGVQVLVNGSPIPLLYVSGSQINAEIPSPLTGTESGIAVIQVVNSATIWDPVQQITYSASFPDFRLAVVSSDFAVFEKSGGSMAVFNQDGTVNKIANPAKPGSVVTIWAAGFGTTGPPVDGAVATAANNYCSNCQLRLYNGAIDITETVQYAGTSPGLIDGLMQINFMVPTQITSNGAWVYFTPPGSSQPLLLGWVDISE